jgi:uncharacterized protein (TIGR02099 family)
LKLIRNAARIAWLTLATLLAVTALSLSALRFWLIPRIADHRDEVASKIGEVVHQPISIGHLSARLRGLSPELILRDVNLSGAQGLSALRFDEARIGVDVLRSMTTATLQPARIALTGGRLSLQRRADGGIALKNLKIRDRLPAWLLAAERIEITDSQLDYEDLQTGEPPLDLGTATIKLVNNGRRHRFYLNLALPEQLGSALTFALDYVGDGFGKENWQGSVYLRTQDLHAEHWRIPGPPAKPLLKSGTANVELWGKLRPGGLERIRGTIQLDKPAFLAQARSANQRFLALSRIEGVFDWRTRPEGWRLDVNRFSLTLGDRAWPLSRVHVEARRVDRGMPGSMTASASFLRLEDVHTVLPLFPGMGDRASDVFDALAPRGDLHDADLSYDAGGKAGERFALCGGFENLGVDAWRKLPALRNLKGRICGNDQEGTLILNTHRARLEIAELFRTPLPLQSLTGEVRWRQTPDEWQLTSGLVAADTPDFTTRNRFRLHLPKQPAASPFLDLQTDFADLKLSRVKHYLPALKMPDTLVRWLDSAFVTGHIKKGKVLLRGVLADFPFAQQQGVFETMFEVKDADLRYHAEWPLLTDLDARALVHNNRIQIATMQGYVGGAPISRGSFEIADFTGDRHAVVHGAVRASLPQTMDYLADSPLRGIPQRLLRHATPAGVADIKLQLNIPLVKGAGKTLVDGSMGLQDAALRLRDLSLELQHINGTLRFTRDALQGKGIRASILGFPATVDVRRGPSGDIAIAVDGRVSAPALQHQFPHDWWTVLRGGSDYHVNLSLPQLTHTDPMPSRLEIVSDLYGLAVQLPAPLSKTENSRKELALALTLDKPGKLPVRLSYGRELQAQLLFSTPPHGTGLDGAVISLGARQPAPAVSGELVLYGQLDQLRIDEWQPWLAGSQSAGGKWPPLREFDLDVAHLYWQEGDLGNWSLHARRESDILTGQFSGQLGNGGFRFATAPGVGSPLEIDFAQVRIPRFSSDTLTRARTVRLEPMALRGIQVKGQRLIWAGADLGSFELEARREPQGLRIRRCELTSGNHRLTLKGAWSDAGHGDRTQLHGQLKVQNMGLFAANLGHPRELRDTRATVDFALDWPGAPHQFSLRKLAGDIKFEFGKGAILNVEPGLGRILSIVNPDNLRRRLMLDFSDLFEKGFAYDRMTGTVTIANGQAETRNSLIKGVTAIIYVNGRAGLVTRDLDQIVTVAPKTTATLPIAGALAGGPAVGAAIYVAQKLIGEEVDSITSTRYAVNGSWDHPVVTRLSGTFPMEMFHRAWGGLKDLSGFGAEEQKAHE